MRIGRRLSLLACVFTLAAAQALSAWSLGRSFAGRDVHHVDPPSSEDSRSDRGLPVAEWAPAAGELSTTPILTVQQTMTATVTPMASVPAATATATSTSRTTPTPEVWPFAVLGLLLTAAVTLALFSANARSRR